MKYGNPVKFNKIRIIADQTYETDTKGSFIEENSKLTVNLHDSNALEVHGKFVDCYDENPENQVLIEVHFLDDNKGCIYKDLKVVGGDAIRDVLVTLALKA